MITDVLDKLHRKSKKNQKRVTDIEKYSSLFEANKDFNDFPSAQSYLVAISHLNDLGCGPYIQKKLEDLSFKQIMILWNIDPVDPLAIMFKRTNIMGLRKKVSK